MLTYHAFITATTTWLYPMLLLLLLSLSFSPFIQAFGVTSINGNVAAKTTSHTHNRVAVYYASRCIDKYNISRFKSSGGSSSRFSCTCNKPHHLSLTLSLSRPTTTLLGVSSSLLHLNSKETAISDDAIDSDDSYNTLSDDNNDNDNEAYFKTEDYQNPIIHNSGNNYSRTKSKTTSSSIKSVTMGRSAVTMGLVTVIVLGGLDSMVPTTAAAATATSDDIKELKELIVQNAIKSDQQFNEINKNYNDNFASINKNINEINEKLVDLKIVPTVTVLASTIINAGAIAISQYMTDKSVRTSENTFTEKVDRTAESFRSSVIISMGIYIAIFVVFGFAISKQV